MPVPAGSDTGGGRLKCGAAAGPGTWLMTDAGRLEDVSVDGALVFGAAAAAVVLAAGAGVVGLIEVAGGGANSDAVAAVRGDAAALGGGSVREVPLVLGTGVAAALGGSGCLLGGSGGEPDRGLGIPGGASGGAGKLALISRPASSNESTARNSVSKISGVSCREPSRSPCSTSSRL